MSSASSSNRLFALAGHLQWPMPPPAAPPRPWRAAGESDAPTANLRSDYAPPDFLIPAVSLHFALGVGAEHTIVTGALSCAGLLAQGGQGGLPAPLACRFLRVPTRFPLTLHGAEMDVTSRWPPWLTGSYHPRSCERVGAAAAPLVLDGEGLSMRKLSIDGRAVDPSGYTITAQTNASTTLTIRSGPPGAFKRPSRFPL